MTIFQTRIQLRHAVLSREGTNQTAVVLCVALRPRGNRTRKWLCGGRERERECLYVERHIYGPINSVFKHSHTFLQRDAVYSQNEKHPDYHEDSARSISDFWCPSNGFVIDPNFSWFELEWELFVYWTRFDGWTKKKIWKDSRESRSKFKRLYRTRVIRMETFERNDGKIRLKSFFRGKNIFFFWIFSR